MNIQQVLSWFCSALMHLIIIFFFLFELHFIVVDIPSDIKNKEDFIPFDQLPFEDYLAYNNLISNINNLSNTALEGDVAISSSQTQVEQIELSYEKISTSYIRNIILKLMENQKLKFNLDIGITVNKEGSITNYILIPEPLDKNVKAFFSKVMLVANPMPKPPIEYQKNDSVTILLHLAK